MKHLADASSFTKIKVSGKDRVEVLHNILTQDIQNIAAGSHAPTAFLNNTGKILFYAEVFAFPDFLILVSENIAPEALMAHLDKLIITEDAVLEDVTALYGYFSAPDNHVDRFLFKASPAASEALIKQGFQIAAPAQAETLRIAAGIPRYGVDMTAETIMNETGLETIAVSHTKGCYPGQEVVARIETYKGLNRKLRKLRLRGEVSLKIGDKIFTEDGSSEIGWITSAAVLDKETAALGYLKKGFFETDLAVSVRSGDTILKAMTV